MKKLTILFFLITILAFTAFAQYDIVSDNGSTISTCSGTFTQGSYSTGTTYSMTVCSDDVLNRHVRLSVTSYSFPTGSSLCIYDGTSTSDPLLVCWDSGTTSGSVGAQASNNNESGCLTFEFSSPVAGASWSGSFSCDFVCQPRMVDIVSATPAISGDGYIDICWDEENGQSEEIVFTAEGTYPTTGYTLDDANVTFHWNFQDGSPIESVLGMNVVSHNFPERRGYVVIVTIEDSQGCFNTNSVTQRVRVSRAPIWNTTTTVANPTEICMGEPVSLCGYYSSVEWVSSVVPSVADEVDLPDGDDVCYESDLVQNQFEPGQTLETVNDLNSICMELCHTFLGDLTMYIQCPNGQTVQIEAQGGGGTDLGNPPNEGYWYCITPTGAQTMDIAAGSQTTLPAGDYASYQSLGGLVGCPLNGTWTIRICDNWLADSGTIFGWYVDFDPSLFPEIWGYTPTYTPTEWSGLFGSEIEDPSNQNCATGTYLTTGTPDVNSDQPFMLTITDDFGCEHDTSLIVTVFHQNDPNCCIQPDPSAGSDDQICSLTYSLSATATVAGNNGYWTLVSGLGNAAFTNFESNATDVSVSLYGTYVFEWTEEYLGNPGCANTSQVEITFLETFDPTLTAIPDMCISEAPVQIIAVDYGTIACTTAPGAIVNGIFDPEIALPGVHSITNTIDNPCTGGPLVSTITVEVWDEIDVVGFTEICGPTGTPTVFTVAWDVVGFEGNPYSGFLVNGVVQAGTNYTEDIDSPNGYNYIVTDPDGCSDFDINGFRDCGCPFFAGTMGTLSTVILCANECTEPDVTHNGDEETDGGTGIFEFMIHTGNNIPLAYSSTPDFCMSDFPSSFNTIYYVSAIVGLPLGGHANISGGCYSISQGTPVLWQQNPIAHAGSDKDTCGLVIRLDGNTPEAGMYGYWSSTCDFFALGGTSYTDPNALVMANNFANCIFTWNVVNGECIASSDVNIGFMSTPNPYSGDDITICGNTSTMAAVPSLPSSDLSWSGNGTTFNPQTSATAEAQVSNYGTYQYTLTESNGACFGQDQLLVTYIQGPSPTTTPNVDSVCGVEYTLEVFNVTGAGQWTAYEDGLPIAPIYDPSSSSELVEVTIGNYPGISREIEFIWEETNQVSGVECTGIASKTVVFAKSPIASVGASNEAEICGNCVTFAADTTGSGWAHGTWVPKGLLGDWDDPDLPAATFCADSLGSFGDSAHVRAPFLWIMRNGGCTSIDTMWVTFYERPFANAGLDNDTCGFNYDLGAVFDIVESDSYSPEGIWSTHHTPTTSATANISPLENDTVQVTATEYGIYEFVFRENNANYTGCYSTDTVSIEFMEIPIISAGEDFNVCGTCTTLEGIGGGFEGTWLPTPGAIFDDYTDPTTGVCVSGYDEITFTWLESNQSTMPLSTGSCPAMDEVIITFWRVPSAVILTDEADSTVCGLQFDRLRAENPGSDIAGNWYDASPATTYGDQTSYDTWARVPSYGYHDFYWIESTGPILQSGFCTDTAGPLTIRFIEIPDANAGGDTLFCGYCGNLSAIPSIGDGVWSTPSTVNITFEDETVNNTEICSSVINTGNPTNPNFEIWWTEDNSNGCTDSDTMKVVFARIPDADLKIIPPKCFGEPATIAAAEDSLQQYTWNFYNGIVDDTVPSNTQGGYNRHFVYWNSEDTLHQVSLVATNSYNCQSVINIDTVYEPPVPDFDYIMISDTCLLGKGGIIFTDTLESNSFFWLDENVGPEPNTPITSVYNIPEGTYDIRTSYLSDNTTHYAYYLITFGSPNCVDTLQYDIETIGMIEAEIEISADIILEDLVAPNASVLFLNNSIYDDVSKRCEWHFGDETIEKNCDPLVEHIYTESGCYVPFLIVMNRDLPECRDTAYLDACIPVDNASKLEIPNIFSPNGDGYNDFFQVKAQTLNTFSGHIVNRWGRTVFTWENWQDYEAGWDGKLNGGTDASPGIYYYIIKAVGTDEVEYDEQGALHLMRE